MLTLKIGRHAIVVTSKAIRRTLASKTGPLEVLQQRVAMGQLTRDDHQMRVAEGLQEVFERIQGYEPQPPKKKFLGMFGKEEKVKPPNGKGFSLRKSQFFKNFH